MKNIALEIKNVSRSYGNTKALTAFTYSFGAGIYALLGPNGSGKTTLMNIITDNLRADSGEVLFGGTPIKRLGSEYRAALGFMPQNPGMYPSFTAVDFMNYMSVLKGIPRARAAVENRDLLEAAELYDVKDRKIRTFSGGMKQRLALAQAFIGDPSVIVLDEPTAGLDPSRRINVRNYISRTAIDRTVIIATHVVSDVEYIAREVIMLRKGDIADSGTPEALAAKAAGMVWTLETAEAEIDRIRESCRIVGIRGTENGVSLRIIADSPPDNAVPAEPTLEDRYLCVFGEASGKE